MKTKFILSSLVLTLNIIVLAVYQSFKGSLESQIAVNQLQDSSFSYGMSSLVLETNIPLIASTILILIWALIWTPTIINLIKKQISKEKSCD